MLSKSDRIRAEELVAELLRLFDLDPDEDESLAETPRRFVGYLEEYTRPFDPQQILKNGFDAKGHSGMVCQSRIPFTGACEHHLLPMHGHASVGYVPNKRVLGLSKMARVVECVGRERPSMQEAICDRIADILNNALDPKGVIVVLKAEHTCMTCRGVGTPGVITATTSIRGIFRDVPAAREEFFAVAEQGTRR